MYKKLPKTSGIYCIRNKTNNKVYFGQACKNQTIKNRIRDHFYLLKINKHPNRHLQSAFNKYGKHNFEASVELYCSDDKLNFYENKYLELWAGNKEICYNIAINATAPMRGRFGELNPFYGKTHTKEVRKAISKRYKGRKLSKSHRENIGKAHKGKKRSEEAKKNMKSSFKGMTFEERFGKKRAKEIKIKQSKSAKERFTDKTKHPRYGKEVNKKQREKQRKRLAGKTYEELYGLEKAKILKEQKQKLKGKKSKNYSWNIHSFVHEDGIIENCTQGELCEKYCLSNKGVSSIVTKYRKSYKGWKLKV